MEVCASTEHLRRDSAGRMKLKPIASLIGPVRSFDGMRFIQAMNNVMYRGAFHWWGGVGCARFQVLLKRWPDGGFMRDRHIICLGRVNDRRLGLV